MSDFITQIADHISKLEKERELCEQLRLVDIDALEKERDQLRELNAELLKSAQGVIAAFDAGVFVRNTSNDHESSWAMTAFPHLRQLAKLVEAVAKAEELK
jgi:hypothetical protein